MNGDVMSGKRTRSLISIAKSDIILVVDMITGYRNGFQSVVHIFGLSVFDILI